jgi:cell surface protein SprA
LTQIWPERSVRDQDNKTDVLVVEYAPTSDSILNPTSAWSGIMRPLFSGMNDQSKTQFIEIWYFPDTSSRRNDNPILHIDAGKITEDLNGDGSNTPNTEDRNFNGVFEQDEDIGLDGLADVNEPGYNASTNPDPNGDNGPIRPIPNRSATIIRGLLEPRVTATILTGSIDLIRKI